LSVDTPTRSESGERTVDRDAGGGWLTFAGVLLVIDGVINVIGGIGAIDDSKFFVANTQFVIGDLKTWGWVILILGVAQLLTAFGLFGRYTAARWAGVLFVSLNAIAQLLLLPAYPLWSLALFTMDILIIYGLVSYGTEEY